MSDARRPHRKKPTGRDAPAGPLLASFTLPVLLIVALVGWIATGLTWGTVVASLAVVILMTGFVMVVVGRLLADDEG